MGLLWAVSFAACYFVSHRILSKERFIWNWWDFAFLPIPPRSFADLSRDFWQVLNIFNSPAWVVTPLGVLASAFLALGLYLIGCAVAGSQVARWSLPAGCPPAVHACRLGPASVSVSWAPALVPGSHGPSAGRGRGGGADAAGRRDSHGCSGRVLALSAGIRRSLEPVDRETHSWRVTTRTVTSCRICSTISNSKPHRGPPDESTVRRR